jgi:hypothetical protein
VFRQSHSNGFPPDTPDDPALHYLRGDEPDRPPRVAIRWRSAYERNDRGFLDAIELALAAGTRVVSKCCLESVGVVPIRDALHFAVVPANRHGGGEHREPLVELLQRKDPSPGPRRELLLLQALQLTAILSRQPQTRRTRRLGLHSNA